MKKQLFNGRKTTLISTVMAASFGMIAADGDGGGDGVDTTTPEFQSALQAAVTSAVAEQTTGLKTKNDELLGKLAEANTAADAYKGIDLEAYKKVMENINQNEEAKLISEGKLEEVLEKRLDSIKAGYQDEITQLTETNANNEQQAANYKSQYETKLVRDAIQTEALKSGIIPESLEHVLMSGAPLFSISESGEIEARTANGELAKTKDGNLMTPERFVESLKTSAPYFWPGSQGSGSRGATTTGVNDKDAMGQLTDIATGGDGQLDLDAYRDQRKKTSGDNYQRRR